MGKLIVFLAFLMLILSSISNASEVQIQAGFSRMQVSQSLETDGWATFQHDPAHTAHTSSQVPETNGTLWMIERTGQLFASPAVVDGRVFIGSRYDSYSPSYVLCVNSSTGRVIWRCESTYTYTYSFPAVFDGKLVISSQSELLCLRVSDGYVLWNYTTREFTCLGGSLAVDEGRVFVHFHRNDVMKQGILCLNATDGSLLWEHETLDYASDPAAFNGMVVVNSLDHVYCLNMSTGAEMWMYTLDNQNYAFSSTSCSDGKIFVGSYKRNWWTSPHPYYKLFCLDSTTGEPLWIFDVDGGIYYPLALVNEKVIFSILRDDEPRGKLYCLNASNGSVVWEHAMMKGGDSTLVATDDKLILVDGGNLCILDQSTRELLWSYCLPTSFSHYFAIAEGRIYIGTGDSFYCLGDMLYFNVTIAPRFYDNLGEPLILLPSSWTVVFPNGTRMTTSSVQTYYGPLGTYALDSIFWKELHLGFGFQQPARITPVSFFLDRDTTWNPRINCTLPTYLSLSLTSSASYIGFKVGIDGNLTCNDVGVPEASILLSYSVTGGQTWNELTLAHTDSDGGYSAEWTPSATGNYIAKASWAGNSTYPKSTASVSLAIIPYEEKQTVFSAESNSTISPLSFNASSLELSFTLTGEAGTTGYVKVTIAKNLASNIAGVKVYLDEAQTEYSAISQEGSWTLTFTYSHSTHQVRIDLSQSRMPELPPFLIIALVIGIVAIVTLLAVILHHRKRV